MREEITHEFEGKVRWTGEKQRMVETTLPIYGECYKYWLPKKCTVDMNESDAEGNFMFVVTDWWMRKAQLGDFQVEDR
jgi:hypothetical protein